MDNTEKLLRAFIEASGYDIKEDRYTIINGVRVEDNGNPMITVDAGDRVTAGFDYIVTKKEEKFIEVSLPTKHGMMHCFRGGRPNDAPPIYVKGSGYKTEDLVEHNDVVYKSLIGSDMYGLNYKDIKDPLGWFEYEVKGDS